MRIINASCVLLVTASTALAGSAGSDCMPEGTTVRISVDEDAFSDSTWASTSDDGLVVAYAYGSFGGGMILVHDRMSGTTTNVSGDVTAYSPALSGNGRYVAFASNTSLDPDHPTDDFHWYLHDRVQGTYELLTLNLAGDPASGEILSFSAPSLSDNGRYVAFETRQTGLVTNPGVNPGATFLRDTLFDETTLISDTSDGSFSSDLAKYPVISGDGRYIAFVANADDIVAGDANGFQDTFLHDTFTGDTILVSVADDGAQGEGDSSLSPALSDDGRFVAFYSNADNLFPDKFTGASDVFLRDTVDNTTQLVSISRAGTSTQGGLNPEMTPDGRYIAFIGVGDDIVEGDTNGVWDVFLYDRIEGAYELVSVSTDEVQQLDPGSISIGINFYTLGLSGDGRTVVWSSEAENLVETPSSNEFDVFLRRLRCGPCPGDVHPPAGDGEVMTSDLLALLGAWGTGDPAYDIAPEPDGDGIVDVIDLLALLGEWGTCP